jgi:hypothetical protein
MSRRKSKRVSVEEPAFAKTINQVALFLDVGERVIYRWLASGAPGKTEKGYDLAAIRAWRGQNLEPPRRTGPKAPLTGDAARLLKARADEKSAVARLRELELEIESGAYTLTSKVQEHNLELISLVTRGLDTWARSLQRLGCPRQLEVPRLDMIADRAPVSDNQNGNEDGTQDRRTDRDPSCARLHGWSGYLARSRYWMLGTVLFSSRITT